MTNTNLKWLTFEEYLNIVDSYLKHSLSNISEKERKAFLKSEEPMIRNKFDKDIARYRAGEIEYGVLTIGSPAGVAHGLDLMY